MPPKENGGSGRSPGGRLRRSKDGRSPAQRRGSSAEAAVQAEAVRLGGPIAEMGVLKHGFLVKKGHVMPTRKERYFILGKGSLSYYKPTKDGDVELKGVLQLKASDVISPMPNSDVWLRVRQNEGPGGKSYKMDLKAPNAQDRRAWVEAIRQACRSELLLRQQTLQSDIRLLQTRSSRRGGNGMAMAEFLSSPMQDRESTPRVDLRSSFQAFHEMVLLNQLVDTIKASWGAPSQWTIPQYQELVQGISLAQEKSGSVDFEPNSILAEAFKLRYQFEEIPDNQRKLSRDDDPLGAPTHSIKGDISPSVVPPRIRCPSFHSYYATFEELSDQVDGIAKSAGDQAKLLTPRSATLAKYAHLYLVDDIRAKQPWSLDRVAGDDFGAIRSDPASTASVSESEIVGKLADRFEGDRIYTYINHHTMVVVNPYRLLQTARFTSIYDEQVVLTYAETANAEETLAPHPFAVAKQSLVRLFFGEQTSRTRNASSALMKPPKGGTSYGQTIFLCGESGSGKTELAKDLLKYLVLVAQPAMSIVTGTKVTSDIRQPRVQLFTSSTKSTIQMRTEEARTIALLEAKGVGSYEIVLLDLHPERWEEMMSVSHSKRLPQVHVDGLFFGFYDKLERLEDEEQLRMYFKNPHAAKKLSTILDSNILLEAFGHATTTMNLNSSRFGKITTLEVSFGLHPWEFQIHGCHIAPFLLEKERVTRERIHVNGDQGDMNFHILYAMVAGVNAFPFMRLLAKELHLEGSQYSTFTYLGRCEHKLADFVSKDDTFKRDVEKLQQVIDGLNDLNVSTEQQKAVFKVLSAVLWLGNIELDYNATTEKLEMNSIGAKGIPNRVVNLLGLQSVESLKRMLTTKTVTLQSTDETFDVALEKGQTNHVRDTLARLLYQVVFDFILDAMNEATKTSGIPANSTVENGTGVGSIDNGVSQLKIVDVFGFEDLHQNSLDQLCINYLSEKLYSREEQIIQASYNHRVDDLTGRLPESRDVLFLYEHSLGIFASLEELTKLHQSENDTTQQEAKRNGLFVRNIYERNGTLLPVPPRALSNGRRQSSPLVNALPFVIPHTRGDVVYDATDFVKKNSDFVYSTLLVGLEASSDPFFLDMLSKSKHFTDMAGGVKTFKNASAKPKLGAKSFVSQFRSHVSALTSGEDVYMPFYFHCIRPNVKKQPSVLNTDLVAQQLRSQRVVRQVTICREMSSAYSAIDVPKDVVLARYRSLLQAPHTMNRVESDDKICIEWVCGLLRDCDSLGVRISSSSVIQFGSISLVERLELLLESREAEAAVKIQSLFLMVMWRHRYLSKKRERRGLANELLAWYGPEKADVVKKLLKKHTGRENELRSKLEMKKQTKLQEMKAVHQLATDIKSLCLGNCGGLDSQAVNDILHDDDMRAVLQQNEKVVLALRDMSLNPNILDTQLDDHDLRAFYEKLVEFLRSKKEEGNSSEYEEVKVVHGLPRGMLDQRVSVASERNRDLWLQLAGKDMWREHREALVEVGEDPEMMLFHSEDKVFVATIEHFLEELALENEREKEQQALDALTNLTHPTTLGEEDGNEDPRLSNVHAKDAEMLELLMSVQFGPPLMTAMNQDAYFVQALQDPTLMDCMHQLMANPNDFASSTALQQPAVREFFLKLIALSLAVQEQSDEE